MLIPHAGADCVSFVAFHLALHWFWRQALAADQMDLCDLHRVPFVVCVDHAAVLASVMLAYFSRRGTVDLFPACGDS